MSTMNASQHWLTWDWQIHLSFRHRFIFSKGIILKVYRNKESAFVVLNEVFPLLFYFRRGRKACCGVEELRHSGDSV